VINTKRRKFLKLSIVTASLLSQKQKIVADDFASNNHNLTYDTYTDEFRFLYGKKENQGIIEDLEIWTNSSIITREKLSSNYTQKDINVPDLNPRGAPYSASYSQIVYQKDRFTYPLKRIGNRGEGKWIRIDWDNAALEVAQHIWDTLVDPMRGTQNLTCKVNNQVIQCKTHSIKRFANQVGANLDENTKRQNNLTNGIYGTDLIILWGYNPMVSNIQDAHILQESRYSGSKIITICPEFSATAKHSDLWLPVKTKKDDLIAWKILQELIDVNMQNQIYHNNENAKNTTLNDISTIYDMLKNKMSTLKEIDFNQTTGIQEDLIKNIISEMVKAKSTKILCGRGYKYNWKIDLIYDLLGIENKKQITEDGFGYLSDFSGKYNSRLTKIEDIDNEQTIITLESSLFNNKSNDYKERLLEKLRYLVCIGTRANETALYADMILPLKGRYETWNVSLSDVDDKTLNYSKPPVGIDSVGESRDEWNIFSLISKKLEEIANKEENINFAKIEDFKEYAREGFRDITTFYQEFSTYNNAGNTQTISDNKSVNDIVFEEEKNRGSNTEMTIPMQIKKDYLKKILASKLKFTEKRINTFNLLLNTFRWSYGTTYNASRTLLRLQRGVPYVLLNPKSAKKYDIVDGENIKIYNDLGEFEVMAKISHLVSEADLILNKSYENYMFKNKLGYGEVMGESIETFVKIEKGNKTV
jgi:anaerobic selenocysteine-containing dehydrogenase